ncbi:DUF3427 domain-containing protein [Desulforamulus aeronauticus]|uniref:Uncharacterized protein n=1 Tax=Desulforamulus aeronauticus DSM 10349 TaxID=1121421 RepID=A0A1M6UYB3_9FIRM|nr:DUF3427 domain-containing protein [Desulforamulus aeronauticus]SHK74242.1 protein of unknown function [Desulforamulus aeronauticus DSM 10349]
MVRPLRKYSDYSRDEVHNIFSPHTTFIPQAGTWGLHGIVKIPNREKDYVFFVTYGQSQSGHTFDEGITEEGILTWQSQPRHKFTHSTIQDFINHNHLTNNIYLFLRTAKGRDYTYLGQLAYLSHDSEREEPVHFKWQILDWELPEGRAQEIGLVLNQTLPQQDSASIQESLPQLTKTDPPAPRTSTQGVTTRDFHGRKVDYSEVDSKRKDLGRAGELLVLEYERKHLIEAGLKDLANKIIHTSEVIGDGAGYDIESFTIEGEKKYIEVKTTTGGINTPFLMSINEVTFSQQNSDNYYLYRIYDFKKQYGTGSFFVIPGNIGEDFVLEPTQFKVRR